MDGGLTRLGLWHSSYALWRGQKYAECAYQRPCIITDKAWKGGADGIRKREKVKGKPRPMLRGYEPTPATPRAHLPGGHFSTMGEERHNEGQEGQEDKEGGGVSDERRRHLRWMEWLWEANSTAAREEARREEVLQVFRDLVRDSERGVPVREYAPEGRRWWP